MKLGLKFWTSATLIILAILASAKDVKKKTTKNNKQQIVSDAEWNPDTIGCGSGIPARIELSEFGHGGCCSHHGGMVVSGKVAGLYASCCTKDKKVLCKDGTESPSCVCKN